VVVNIVAFHAFLAPAGLAIPLLFTALGVYLAYAHRAAFAPMLQARTPTGEPASERARLGGHALSQS
jgi:hypothetical protein